MVVMVTPRCTDISVTRQGFDGVFRTSRTDAVEVVAAAEFARERLKVDRVFLVHDGTAYGRGLRDVFRLVWGKDNLAGSVEALRGTQDYGSVVRAIRNSTAEMIYYGGFADDAARFVHQLRMAGVTVPVMAPDALMDAAAFVGAAGPAAEGTYVTRAEQEPGPAHAAFAAAYRDRFGVEPAPSAAEGYDAANVLIEAIERTARVSGDRLRIDRRALRSALPHTDMTGASGRIRFRANGDRREGASVRIFRVADGRFVEQALVRPE
jgi:branched-chain amino acid transport system substrate-binding protein